MAAFAERGGAATPTQEALPSGLKIPLKQPKEVIFVSRFLCPAVSGLAPYTPGEQPRDMRYIKLNTNESPFPPSPKVVEALTEEERQKLRLYSDPTCKDLVDAIAKRYGLHAGAGAAGQRQRREPGLCLPGLLRRQPGSGLCGHHLRLLQGLG